MKHGITHPKKRDWQVAPRCLGLVLGAILFTPYADLARADDSAPATTSAPETGLVRRGLPTVRGLSISIADGLIRVVKDKRVARIALRWDYLPLDSQLLQDFAIRRLTLTPSVAPTKSKKSDSFRLVPPAELTLVDAQFPDSVASDTSTGRVEKSTLDQAHKIVFDQLASGKAIDPQSLAKWDRLFSIYWEEPGNGGYEAIAGGLINGRQYYGILRDHQLLYHVISGSTPRFILHLPATGEVYLPPRSASFWKLKTYAFSAGAGTNRVDFDRYSFSLVPEPFDVELSDVKDNSDVVLETTAVWENGDGINPADPLINFKNATVVAATPPAASELPEAPEEESTGNWLEAVLKMGGNTSLGDVTGKLFGSKNSSVFAGALVSKGEVGRVVGLNFEKETSKNARPGVMVGIDVDTSDKLNLFAGPSLSVNAIQLALGARFTTREEGNERSSFKVRPAAVLAFDLSRAFGGKEERTSLEVDSTRASYDWGKSSDEVFSETIGLGTIVISAETVGALTNPSLQLERVKVGADNTVKVTVPPVRINIALNGQERIIFLPQGSYRWVTQPATAALVAVEGTAETPIEEAALLEIKPQIKPTDTTTRLRVRLRPATP